MKTAFITGGAGFIGSHLADLLIEKGWNVRILVRSGKMHKKYKDIVYDETIKNLKKKGAEIFYGNLLKTDGFEDALSNVDVLFHVGGVAYPYHGLPRDEYFKINTESTKELARTALRKKVKRFVYVSSIEAAGPSQDGRPLTEESSRKPTDAYGESKKESEDFLNGLYKKHKDRMEIVIVRPPMTYGERSPLLARLFKYVKRGFFPMFGSGNALFEFCYVKNLVHGMYLAGTKDEANGQTYFISEHSYKVVDVVREVADVMGVKLRVIHIPKWIAYCLGFAMEILNFILPFYPFRGKETGSPIFSRKSVGWITNDKYICSIEKIKNELGYKPIYPRREGIKNTIIWYENMGLI